MLNNWHPNFNFMKLNTLAFTFSIALSVVAIVSLFVNGLEWGLDFTGGTSIEVSFDKKPELNAIRDLLEKADYKDVVVQNYGSEKNILIRLNQSFSENIGAEVTSALTSYDPKVELKKSEFVGSQVGDELKEMGGIGVLVALAGILLYVSLRFQYKFAVGAVLSLLHDVIILLGFFSILHIEFDLTVLAAIMAVMGYSLNDTIVVYDRIREIFRQSRGKVEADELINKAINQTLIRTTVTSLTTLLVVFALFFWGGDMIHNFALALIVGIVFGTYSSIYVGGSLLLKLKLIREDLLPPEKKAVEDNMP